MAVTMNQVRAALTPEEPDYNQAATLGPEALPYLRTLVQEAEPMLASKATYLASLIEHPDAVAVVRDAAQSNKSVVKVAAAAAAANLSSEEASDIIASLITDPDIGVRKTAIKAVPPDATDRVQAALTRVSDSDSHPELRSLSSNMLNMIASYGGQSSGIDEGQGGGSVPGGVGPVAGVRAPDSPLAGEGGGSIGDSPQSVTMSGEGQGGGDLYGTVGPSASQLTPAGGVGTQSSPSYVSQSDNGESSLAGTGGGSLETAAATQPTRASETRRKRR